MESASLHDQHQLQQHFVGCSPLATQSGYGVSTTHDWNPSIILNYSNYYTYVNEILPNSRELWPKNSITVPPVKASMIQDLGFRDARSFTNQPVNELHFAKIKEGMPDSVPEFSEMVYGASNLEELHLPSTSYIKHDQQCCHDLVHENIWLSNFSSGRQITGFQCSNGELFSNAQNSACFGDITLPSRVNFSHGFPSRNISDRDLSLSLVSSSLGLNLQSSDLLTSTNHGGSLGQSLHDNLGLFRQSMSLGQDQMQESNNNTPSNNSNKKSAFMNGFARKRPSSPEPKVPHAVTKKPRFGSQSSCPPLKVRKEKLGDRIAALQRLVAPFGKTDTASVLTEAIGYIQFLQDQIQTLSVPYMNSSGSKPYKTMHVEMGSKEDGDEEPKQDLRSRGLCLVPISCTSYITTYSNGRIQTSP